MHVPSYNTNQLSNTKHFTVLSDEAIISNALLFLLAGYDTTAGTLSFLLYNFVVHPECQEKAYQEIQDIIGTEVS